MSSNNNSKSVLTALTATLGPDVVAKIQSSKILLVGSGGIGCELIKNLTLSGFRHCVTIDMDTIDVSNLNRQLLFRSQHVGKSKCEVACVVAEDMIGKDDNNASTDADAEELQPISYQAHHGNVCDNSKFNVHFMSQFDLVLNALDNVTARRRVNRLCLAAGLPLIEAGTTGYLGQVNVMDKASGVACYECTTQEVQKVYPICTIRSTPSMPVHTIVWAKELYRLCFAQEKMEESMLYEDPQGEEPSTFMPAVMAWRALLFGSEKATQEQLMEAGKALLQTLFVDEIQKQLDMDRYKAAQKKPNVLNADVIAEGSALEAVPSKTKATDALWTPVECVAETLACLVEACVEPTALLPVFDKDDDLAMRWVTAASNLRSHVFQIEPLQSLYSAKGIAGNIIPAIATTNAIVAGLQMIQVINILKSRLTPENQGQKGGNLQEVCQYVNCIRQSTRNGLYLTASKLNAPNPNCFVCKNATVPITINTKEWTLERFLRRVVKQELGFAEPSLMLEDDMIWEEGQDADQEAFVANLPKTLDKLPCGGIHHGTVLEIEDFSQDLQVNVAIAHQEVWEGEIYDNPDQRFVVGGTPPKATAPAAAVTPSPAADAKVPAAAKAEPEASGTAAADAKAEDSDSDIEAWDASADTKPAAKKRPVGGSVEEPPAKKAKANDDDDEIEVIELE